MATDKVIYEYSTYFPNAMAKFIHAENDDYQAKSITFKETEKRADIFLIGRSGKNVVLVEPQGYDNNELYYDMLKKVVYFCTQHQYWERIDAVAIFLDDSHYHAAERIFKRQFEQSSLLRFTPRVFIFSRIQVDELGAMDDVHLVPLYPLCNIAPQMIEQLASSWAEQIKNAPNLQIGERKNLLALLGGTISHRIKNISEEDIDHLFGGFTMEDTPIGQAILQRGKREGKREGKRVGERLGIRHVLLKQIAARFGTVPEDIRKKVEKISNTERLDRIATALLTIQSIDELKDLVN